MSRWAFVVSRSNLTMLHAWLDRAAALGMRVTFQEPKRSDAQNRLMWPYLTAISQQLEWHGQKYPPDDWKDFLMHQLGRGRWMPAEEGGMVPIGMRTSDLSKGEFGDLIVVIQAFAARNDVNLGDEEPAQDSDAESPPEASEMLAPVETADEAGPAGAGDHFPGDTPPAGNGEEAAPDDGPGAATDLIGWADRLIDDLPVLTDEQVAHIEGDRRELGRFALLKVTDLDKAKALEAAINARKKAGAR